MILAIPNQPLSFTDTRLQGCLCPQPEECLLVDLIDTVSFQLQYDPCLSEQLVASPFFEDPTDWIGPTWQITAGVNACLTGIPPYSPLVETSFTPVLASVYQIRMNFTDVTGPSTGAGLRVTLGGVLDEIITSAENGDQTWTVQTLSPGPLVIQSYLDGTGCVTYAEIYEVTPELLVEVMDGPDVVGELEWSLLTLSHFVFVEDRVTITFDLGDLELGGYPAEIEAGCYTINVTDQCDGTILRSQCVSIDDYARTDADNYNCTILIRACNAGDGVGFLGEFTPTMRVRSKLTRPTYEYEVREERLSNGRIDRYYADRRQTMELRIDRLGEMGHRFISSLVLWDHVYLGLEPYVVKADAYEPGYGDVYESYGGILLKVEPYQELARKVRCDEDDGGCAPPPNYFVQFTGPNEDYVLQSSTGERILLY